MIAVFFGGRSCEHDISIITGLQAMSACKRKCVGVYIDCDGLWWAADCFDSAAAVRNKKFKGKPVHIRPSEPYLYCKNKRVGRIDAALLCMHGVLGEDGALQGLLEMCGVPYTGSGVEASAIGMNKLRTKSVFESAGLEVLPYVPLTRTEYVKNANAAISGAQKIGYPIIVKPCNLGSSIGISVAKSDTELFTALRVAFEWDDVVIMEKALADFTEVNCAVIECGDGELKISETEQPVGWKTFLTFADKYSGDVKSERRKSPADVGDDVNAQIQRSAEAAYKAVGCSGVARVDFLVKDGHVYANEINTIPGSLASGLFDGELCFSELIELLIDGALRRKRRFDALKRVYEPATPVITNKF